MSSEAPYTDELHRLENAVRQFLAYRLLNEELDGGIIPEAPVELEYLTFLEQFGCLPWPGGLEQQPHLLMQQLSICKRQRAQIDAIVKQNKEAEAANAALKQQSARPITLLPQVGGD